MIDADEARSRAAAEELTVHTATQEEGERRAAGERALEFAAAADRDARERKAREAAERQAAEQKAALEAAAAAERDARDRKAREAAERKAAQQRAVEAAAAAERNAPEREAHREAERREADRRAAERPGALEVAVAPEARRVGASELPIYAWVHTAGRAPASSDASDWPWALVRAREELEAGKAL